MHLPALLQSVAQCHDAAYAQRVGWQQVPSREERPEEEPHAAQKLSARPGKHGDRTAGRQLSSTGTVTAVRVWVLGG